MRQLMIAVMMMGGVLVAQPAQANVLDDALGLGKKTVAWCWNFLPGSIRLVSIGGKWVCKGIHGATDIADDTADLIEIKTAE